MDNDGDWKPGASCLPRYPTQFKKTVVLFAEKFSNREAERTFGIAESNIRRWKKLKPILFSDGLVSDSPEGGGGNSVPTKLEGSGKKKGQKSNPILPGTSFEDSIGSPDADHFEKTNDSEENEMSQKKDDKSDSDCEEVCLRWNSHHHNMKNMFPMLLQKEQFVDVTLTSGGKVLKCHKLILSSCSTYFENMLADVPPNQHAIIFLNTIPFWLLKILVDFMYTGEVHIDQNKVQELLGVAEILQIKGLTGKSNEKQGEQEKESQHQKEQSQKVQNVTQNVSQNPQNVNTTSQTDVTNSQNANKIPQNEQTVQNTNQNASKITVGNQKSKIDAKQIISSKESVENKTEINENKHLAGKKEIKQSQQQQQHNVKLKVIKLQSADTMPLLKPIYIENSNDGSGTNVNSKKDSPKKPQPPAKKSIRKRKSCEESIPPILYRKGTKSRPHVKVPRYYHNEDYDHDDLKTLRARSLPLPNENVDKKEKKKEIVEKLETNCDISDKNISNNDATLECSLDKIKTETLDVDDTEVVFAEISLD